MKTPQQALADRLEAECYDKEKIEAEYLDIRDVCGGCGVQEHVSFMIGGYCGICANDALNDEWNRSW